MSFYTINPANEETINEYNEFSEKKISEILDNNLAVQKKWKQEPFYKKSELMLNASKVILENKRKYAELMTLEMGKPISQSIAEVEKCAWVCRFYAENAESFLNDMPIKTEYSKSFVSFLPLGAVLAIMPWNFPFWQVFRFAAPALMAGNSAILKHSRNTMGCAVMMEEIFLKAGFPENLFKNLVIGSSQVKSIIEDRRIAAVTLTGSTPVGSSVAQTAGSVIKKTVMELGGSDPYIILEDADLVSAAKICVDARMINSGQSCIAAKRFIVSEKVHDDFLGHFLKFSNEKIMGNPMLESVNIGPQARKDLQMELNEQVTKSVKLGAKLELGGEIPNSKGYFYPPTVLSNVKKGMPAYDEELFGPVASVIKFKSEKEAIEIANDSIFGLGGAVFSRDIEKAETIARDYVEAGCVFINDSVKSDPRLPFGGIKESGYGRELACFGIREFVNIKSVVLK